MEINKIVAENQVPPRDDFRVDWFSEFWGKRKGEILLIADQPGREVWQERGLSTTLHTLEAEHKDLKIFMIEKLDWGSEEAEMLRDILGIVNHKEPAMYILKPKEDLGEDKGLIWKKYKWKNPNFDPQSPTEFMNDFYAGKLEEFFKSSTPPIMNNGSLKVVVQKTFRQFTRDKKRSCVIVFYSSKARYCYEDYCMRSLGFLEKISEEFNKNEREDVWFGKMDAITDETLDYEIDLFPTILVFKAGGEAGPQGYTGEMKLKDLRNWLQEILPEGEKDDLGDYDFEGDM